MSIRMFLRKVVLFIAPIIAVFVIAESLLRNIPNDYSKKNNLLESASDELEILILGNSHSFRGINPNYLDGKVFNMAYVSQSLDLDSKIVLSNLPKLPHLKHVIFCISYPSLYKKLDNSSENWRMKNYKIYYHLFGKVASLKSSELLESNPIISIKRLIGHYVGGKKFITINKLGYSAKGGKKIENFEKQAKIAIERHTVEMPGDYNEMSTLFLNSIERLIKRGIRVEIVHPPMSESYRDLMNGRQFSKMINVCDSLAHSHQMIRSFDFTKDSSFTSDHFFNSDHLNETGAQVLSRKLNSLIMLEGIVQ